MCIRFLVLLVSLMPCFVGAATVSSNEPEDADIGLVIRMGGEHFTSSVGVGSGASLLLMPDLSGAKVVKDRANGLNHFNAVVGYRLSVSGVERSGFNFLYLQCPIASHTYINRSEPEYEVVDGERVLVGEAIFLDTLEMKTLSSGYYKFLPSGKSKTPAFSGNLPTVGKISQNSELSLLCTEIDLAYVKYKMTKINREVTLKQLGILE